MEGLFITFEGTEGSGKSTQIRLLTERLRGLGKEVRLVREPGGTPIGEEIRHTLQHSAQNAAMTPEAELLLINASRAQLVREVIKPALNAGEIVVCDRYYHSTLAYQGYGRGLDLDVVRKLIAFAIDGVKPDLTLLLFISIADSERRRAERQVQLEPKRDRMEEADRDFFKRVEQGYSAIAAEEADRVKWIDATQDVATVEEGVWGAVSSLLKRPTS